MPEAAQKYLKEKIKKVLLRKKREKVEELRILNFKAKEMLCLPQIPHSDHPADNSTGLVNIPEKRSRTVRKMIHKYDAALIRVESGEYGICKDCREPIPLARLEAVPTADRCTECKTAAEKRDTISVMGTPRRISRVAVIIL